MPTVVSNDSRFQIELTNAGSKLVVVDFMASWCRPCHRVAPSFESLSHRNPSSVFLKVDVDQCPETAASQGITAMPTFVFYRSGARLAEVKGANIADVEAKLKELTTEGSGEAPDVQGHVDLASLISKSACECLNDCDEHPFAHCLVDDTSGYLESDCDAQLIMSYGFNQAVKLHSIKIKAPESNGPRTLKLFINQPRTLDFDQADSSEPTQTLELKPSDLSGENPVLLRFVKFQNVQNLQVFVQDNQGSCETTRIDHLAIIGSSLASNTNMGDFKRVAGKKGESH